jgi:hypothetical protein
LHDGSDNFIRASLGTSRMLELLDQMRNKDHEFRFVRKIPGILFREFQPDHLKFRKAFG